MARSLIRAVYGDDTPSAEDEQRFFSRLKLPGGVLKTTEPHRLDDLNALVQRLLPDARPLELMDVAASSAITSLEWSEQLAASGIEHRLVVGDLHVRGAWLSLLGAADILLDRNRRTFLYADVAGRGIDVEAGTWRSAAAMRLLRGMASGWRALHLPVREVELVSAQVRAADAIAVVEDDIFVRRAELASRFHAVRAANILNRLYFDDARLLAAVTTLRERLRPGGLLIVCRTHEDGSNHATVFAATESGWDALARLGDGSEIEQLLQP